jgi:hypothetical protein
MKYKTTLYCRDKGKYVVIKECYVCPYLKWEDCKEFKEFTKGEK